MDLSQAANDTEEFAEYIKHMRNSLNWSTSQLGEALGVHARTIKHWENGNGLSKHNINELAANIRLVVKNEQKRLRKINEINDQYSNKYSFKGGKLVHV